MMDAPPPTKGIQLGHLLGARVVLQPSTLLMIGLLAWIFASGAGDVTGRTLAMGVILAVLLFASVFIHEVAHALAARGFKREVREIVLTLWGGHTSFDSTDMRPVVHAVTAGVGPLMNVVIAGVAQAVLFTGLVDGSAAAVLAWLVGSNLLLAVFNALPGIPMDGGRVLEAIVWAATKSRHRGTVVAAWGGRAVAVGVVLYAIGGPLSRGEKLDVTDLVFAGLIASILWPAASAALKYSQMMGRREDLSVRKIMVPAVGVRYDMSVAEAREAASTLSAREVVVLSADSAAAGHFPLTITDEVPADARAATSLQAVTIPVPRGAEVQAALAGDDLVRSLREWWGRTDVWVVREGDAIVGVVPLSAVLEALK